MRDFTLQAYTVYIQQLKEKIGVFYRFDEFLGLQNKEDRFCLLRHDVDRHPQRALKMAQLEHQAGVKASYYFRLKPGSFNQGVIKQIDAMGHEIGYHYESLSDMNGDMDKALEDFERNLDKLRKLVPVKTCSMHGSPFKPHDNRELWKSETNHRHLIKDLGILGEVYLDIDYHDIAYISDTGRNWHGTRNNIRDTTNSKVKTDFDSGEQLLQYIGSGNAHKIVFQIHPERWTDNAFDYYMQYGKDTAANFVKRIVN